MSRPDLNLLYTLDVLLSEGSVVRAARRLRLSPSAMSRALARLRETLSDPLLVRAGRGLVPTSRAVALRERVRLLVEDAEAVLRPAERLDLAKLARTFTIRSSDGFAETFGPPLITRIEKEAPGVRLRFVRKLNKDSSALRDGAADLETGVVDASMGPELRLQTLFRDRFVGVARRDHPFAAELGSISGYVGCRHVSVSRHDKGGGPVEAALSAVPARRDVVVSVDGYSAALALVRETDLLATVPERHTTEMRADLHTFPLPFKSPDITVSMLWHPRLDEDPAHRWLRQCVKEVCSAP